MSSRCSYITRETNKALKNDELSAASPPPMTLSTTGICNHKREQEDEYLTSMATPASSQLSKTLDQESWIITFSLSVSGLRRSTWSSSPSPCILSIWEHSRTGLSTHAGHIRDRQTDSTHSPNKQTPVPTSDVLRLLCDRGRELLPFPPLSGGCLCSPPLNLRQMSEEQGWEKKPHTRARTQELQAVSREEPLYSTF